MVRGQHHTREGLLYGISGFSLLVGLGLCVGVGDAAANPVDGKVVAGSASISASKNKLTVNQQSQRAVIEWGNFNIGKGEHTHFAQPNADSVTLNRVMSKDPSSIAGKLTANGNIVLVNPNGVVFERGSQVDVGGLVATTSDISNKQFMKGGKLRFDKPGNKDAAIINQGTITAKEAGLVGLVAPHVLNDGVIAAKLGRVQIAAADTVTVDLYGDGLLEIKASDAMTEGLVSNRGSISAEGGLIALTAAEGKALVNSLITVEGELSAPTIKEQHGTIIIAAEKNSNKTATVLTANTLINVSGLDKNETGGNIEITGDQIGILDNTTIAASGQAGGGDIKVGGDYLGTGDTPTAQNLYVSSTAITLNDALNKGDGGRTIFWSDEDTHFHGTVYARGGQNGGDGGFLETSGKEYLNATGFADLTAEKGEKGTYLLDPANITIYGNVDPEFVSTDVSIDLASDLQLWLDAADSTQVELTYSTDALAGPRPPALAAAPPSPPAQTFPPTSSSAQGFDWVPQAQLLPLIRKVRILTPSLALQVPPSPSLKH